jgi:hypothetical protein
MCSLSKKNFPIKASDAELESTKHQVACIASPLVADHVPRQHYPPIASSDDAQLRPLYLLYIELNMVLPAPCGCLLRPVRKHPLPL